jgi:PAS domain S-box-containing protein
LIVTRDGRVAFFSARAEELTGLRVADVLGRPCSEIQRCGLCGLEEAALGGVASDHEEFRLIAADGSAQRAHRSVRPVRDGNGAVLGVVVTFHVLSTQPPDFLGPEVDVPDRRGRYQPRARGESEARLIRAALESQGYHRQRTAGILGMDRVTLYRKMRSYGISVPSGGGGES